MAYQEQRTTGYGTRVGNSFKAIGTGFILFCIGTALLWWNEGRTVKTEKMLEEVGGSYVEMENPNKKDASLDGELICGSALATTEDSLSDNQFGVGAKAIALHRRVEYYQWVEDSKESSEDKLGGKEVTTTTYTYSKKWVSTPVESSEFKDPAYQNKNTVLSEDMLNQLDKSAQTAYERFYGVKKSAKQTVEQLEETTVLSDSAKAVADSLKTVNDSIIKNAVNKKDFEYVHQAGNVLYFGRVPGSPEIGDVRVTFEKVVPAKVTVMAVVDGDSFKAFKAKNGKRFQRLVMGKKSGDEIIDIEKETNNMLLWVFRIFGVMLVIGGLKGIFGFLETVLKVVPFIANIFGWGVGVVCTILGLVWSLIIIAIAWLFYRPILGITLLVIAGFLTWVFAFKGKDKLKELAAKTKK